jgi:fumarate reductase flavoprotein subunit
MHGQLLTWILAAALGWFLWGVALWPPGPAWAAQASLLGEKHRTVAVPCTGCHTETPPKAPPQGATCLGCHGGHDKVAARTGKLEPNPHASHLGRIGCDKCHHVHKPSENYCGSCHDIDLTVP